MVRVTFLQRTQMRGGPHYNPGEQADVGEEFAAWATRAGVAVLAPPSSSDKAVVRPPADKMLRQPGKAK